jgi:hypothetical protein
VSEWTFFVIKACFYHRIQKNTLKKVRMLYLTFRMMEYKKRVDKDFIEVNDEKSMIKIQ